MHHLTTFLFVFLFAQIATGQPVVFIQEIQTERLPIGNLLSWKTEKEDPDLMFDVERSYDGISYESYYTESGKGSKGSGGSLYQHLVPDNDPDKWTYRLKVWKSNLLVYTSSPVISEETLNEYSIHSLRVSDVRGFVEIVLVSRLKGLLNFSLLSKDRVLIDEGEWLLVGGEQSFRLDLSDLPIDTYTLVIRKETEVEEIAFRKVEDGEVIVTDMARMD